LRLEEQIKNMPGKPGVYQFLNSEGNVIYIGKAKNLKKRVSSYFHRENYDNNKTRVLVKKIHHINFIVVDSESDALLLENNLIKKYQPRYNVLLKDDKSFPWICIKNETFPRIFMTRNPVQDGSLFYGPYTSVGMVRTILEFIRELYPLRNCKLNLSKDNIAKKKFKVCLEYHLGNCKGPCENFQNEVDYNRNIENIKHILKGNISSVKIYFKEIMKQHAENFRFEEAQAVKDKLILVEKYQSKSTIVSASINNVDVFAILDDDGVAYVNCLRILGGSIMQSHTLDIKKRLNETPEEIFSYAINELRNRLASDSREAIVPFIPEFVLDDVHFKIPQKGDRLKLLQLSERNLRYYRLEKKKIKANSKIVYPAERILKNAQKDLQLPSIPVHIECFDNSNIQGTNPVAACVVFKNARPAPSAYRHYNIKTVQGPDDFASMREVVYRRYKRLLEEEKSLPQLIVIDGGKGQLNAAVQGLKELEIFNKIGIIGIAKRLEEIFFPGDSVPLYLDKNSETLKLIQNLRNEAHRFGINFHRTKRSSGIGKSELYEIPGIGDKMVEMLLKEFHSISNIKQASLSDIQNLIGGKKGSLVFDYFRKSRLKG